MRRRRFIRKVGSKSLHQKRYLITFFIIFIISTFVFRCIQLSFVKVVQDKEGTTTQLREESYPIKTDGRATIIKKVSGSENNRAENSFQLTEKRSPRKNGQSGAFKQHLSLLSNLSNSAESHMPVAGSTEKFSDASKLFVKPANILVNSGSFVYLRLFPKLAIVALSDPQNDLKENVTEEDNDPVDGGSPFEWIHGPDPFLTTADKRLGPLRKVRIQLLRQRVNRQHWAVSSSSTATGDGYAFREPMISLTPVESPLLHFPSELLVEEYLPSVNGVNSHPDPWCVVPIAVSAATAACDEHVEAQIVGRKSGRTVRSTSKTGGFLFFPKSDLNHNSVTYPQPLIEAIPAEADKLSSPQLLWRPDSNCGSMTISVQLLKIKPPFTSIGNAQQKLQDSTRTEALAASFNLKGVIRLYGLPRREGTARSMLNNRLIVQIPFNGFHYIASIKGFDKEGRSLEVGVLPIVFVELDGSSSSCSSLRQRQGVAHRTVGILWFNGSPFFVSTASLPSSFRASGSRDTNPSFTVQLNFTSSAAATRIYLLPGPTAAEVLKQYYTLTGFPTMPPLMALGCHYHLRILLTSNATNFVRTINRAFWDGRVPLDSIGLTSSTVNQNGTSLTWNHNVLPDPMHVQEELWRYGRRSFIVRVVPTIPIIQSSPLYYEGRHYRHFISLNPDDDTWWVAYTEDGQRSHVIDFVSPTARQWFGRMFKYKKFTKSTNFTFVALQHAAPVLLGTLDSTLPMSVGHTRGIMHRQVHNVFNVYAAMAVHHGLLHRNIYHRRSFITTENYYLGVHRFGGVFLRYGLFSLERVGETAPRGYQLSSSSTAPLKSSQIAWQNLRDSIHDCASFGIMGIPFSGVNIAEGIIGSVSIWSELSGLEREELLTRWFQAASIFPLMQIEEFVGVSPREEEAVVSRLALAMSYPGVRDAVRFRYALLPYLYTTMWRVSEDGSPMLQASITQEQNEETDKQGDDAVCVSVGSELIACPCVRLLNYSVSWRGDAKIRLPYSLRGAQYSNYWTGGCWEAGSRVPLWPRVAKVDRVWLGKSRSFEHSELGSTSIPIRTDLPLFQRVGSIVTTFLALDGQMASTRTPANYSLTIALPRRLRTAWQDSLRAPDKLIPLASGEVYWDDGTKNTQTRPPSPKAQSHREQASTFKQAYCHVRLECYLLRGTLMLSGTQVSSSCVDSLTSLAFTWNDLPPQMDAWLRPLVERQESAHHAEDVKRDQEEDRGLHNSKRNLKHSAANMKITSTVDDSDRDLNTMIRDNLNTTFLLHYVRFLVASPEDRLWLAQRLGSILEPTIEANSLTLVARLTAMPIGKVGVSSMKYRVRSLFGLRPPTMAAVGVNRSDNVHETPSWVIEF